MGVKVRIHSSVGIHRGLAGCAFIKASTEQEMNNWGIAKHFCLLFDESLCWTYFHSVSAPTELTDGSGITTPNQVAPERLFMLGNKFNHFNRKGVGRIEKLLVGSMNTSLSAQKHLGQK